MTKLSPRETEVCTLIGRDGKHYKTVGRDLGISVHTVKTYVQRIAIKGGLTDRNPRDAMIAIYYTLLCPPQG